MATPASTPLTLLAIDDTAFPLRRNLCFYLSKPKVRPEPVLTPEHGNPDAPDNAATQFYGGVVFDQGTYRMWYYACHWAKTQNNPHLGNLTEGPTCYAESDDGLHWIKPNLGQVEWCGNKRNNIIRLAETHTEGVHVILDAADPDPGRRYKMVYNYMPAGRNFWTIRTATSPDGLSWTDGPLLPYDGFLEQASLYRFGDMYYVSGQMLAHSEGGHRSGRQGFAIVSPDFEHWLPECGESFLLPEPMDPEQRGHTKPYDQVHIGVGASSFGNVAVGLYCIWHNKSFPTEKDWFGEGTTSGDFGLVVSNDGLHFREPVKGYVFLHRDESPAQVPATIRHARILCQGNGILNVGDETRIYHGRWANTADINEYHGEVALATLPRDRWGALGLVPELAEGAEGTAWSGPITVPAGGKVLVNADDAGAIRVEVADERFGLIAGYSGEQSGKVGGDGGLECPVRWAGAGGGGGAGGGLAVLAGRRVRLRFHLSPAGGAKPRLYAAYLSGG